MLNLCLAVLLLPLLASLIAGLLGKKLSRMVVHCIAIGAVFLSFVLSVIVFKQVVLDGANPVNLLVYEWMRIGDYQFEVGFLIDSLSASMMMVVTFVSLMVHIYTVGYMDHDEDYEHDNPYYQRFFSYIALFTFAMLSLVMSNNFLQLFFGWEAVGVVSYLLIGFYTKRSSAVTANLKAFLVNRFGDFGFLLGIAGVLMFFGTLNYAEFFQALQDNRNQTMSIWGGAEWQVVTVIGILLFIGAMGKSAQMPLHVWLPESMEGPTPISALIHAATMVTAGIFMVARLSPLYEMSEVALSFILITGATTALMMGLIGIVQNDIKRIVAYSTLSQLGYMIAALGASAYAIGFFHVMTHAFFKALLFLGAGSVIIGMHHKQDIWQMGGLRKYMPITWVCMLLGSMSLIGIPGFSGFFSKDSIIIALGESQAFGATYAYYALIFSVFVTAFYSFRLFFVVFHGKESHYVSAHTPHESPKTITLPLILLAIPSVMIGAITVDAWVLGDYFSDSISVLAQHDVTAALAAKYQSGMAMFTHGWVALPTYLALSGVVVAWLLYIKLPDLPGKIKQRFSWVHCILAKGYGFDAFNDWFFVRGSKALGYFFWQKGDMALIDDGIVNNTASGLGKMALIIRQSQSGYLYHYAFVIIIGLMSMLAWLFVA